MVEARRERDLAEVFACCSEVLAADQPPANADALRVEQLEALVTLADPQVDAVLAALPLGGPLQRLQRLVWGMRVAQSRYRFGQAVAMAAALLPLKAEPDLFEIQRTGVRLALQLALMQGDLAEAGRWQQAHVQLHALQVDPALQRLSGAEPMRAWRLELSACPAGQVLQQRALAAPSEAMLREVLDALGEEPQATSLAFALLLSVRRLGYLDAFCPIDHASGPLIPQTFWLLRRHGVTSAVLEAREQRWRQLHPGWEVQWLDHQLAAIEAMEELPELVRQACLCALDPGIRGDLLRLAVLWRHGGVVLDWGCQPLHSLEPWLAGSELLLVQDGLGMISSTLWAAPPRHPWVGEALQKACLYVLECQGYSRWDLTGGCLLSGVTARQLAPALRREGALPVGVRVLAVSELQRRLGLGAWEPRPEGATAETPAAAGPIDRRRCGWVVRTRGSHLALH